MDVTDLLTPVALKRVENMIINRTNIRIKHTKFKKHIPKIKYCRKYKNVTSYNYYYNDIIYHTHLLNFQRIFLDI